MARRYPQEVADFIAANVVGRSVRELVELTNARFGTEFTESSMHAYKANHKLKSGVPTGRKVGTFTSTFPKPVAEYIIQHYKGCSYSEMVERLQAKFGRSYTAQQINSFYGNHHLNSGLSGRFEKGHISFNKGKKGWSALGTEQTRFKKGNLPANTKPIGYERITKDGYIEVKIAMRPTRTDCNDNFVTKHRLVWEAANGHIPPGHILIFRDGNKLNCELSNLRLITTAENCELNRRSLRSSNPDYTDTGVLIAKVNVAANAKKKRQRKGARTRDTRNRPRKYDVGIRHDEPRRLPH